MEFGTLRLKLGSQNLEFKTQDLKFGTLGMESEAENLEFRAEILQL
jgi:hypothetical protein